MIKATTLEIGEPTQGMLVDLKKHAAVPDNTQDALLMTYLRRAIPAVQDAADKSIVPETIELVVTEREDNEPIRLYESVAAIVSVKDGEGNALDYSVLANAWVKPYFFTREVVITYKTMPKQPAIRSLAYYVSEYAADLYAGATPEELAKVLLGI